MKDDTEWFCKTVYDGLTQQEKDYVDRTGVEILDTSTLRYAPLVDTEFDYTRLTNLRKKEK